MVACPYDARSAWDGKTTYFKEGPTPYEEKKYPEHAAGAAQKCDFCVDRLEKGLKPYCVQTCLKGLKPYCVQTCLTGALMFGDFDDPNSEVSEALSSGHHFHRLREELGTKPSVYYLA
jgi:phenylacetyl-CoA:acceptor oxidoreductase subunit 1